MTIWSDIKELLFPRFCIVCGKRLNKTEPYICTSCLLTLPRTGYEREEQNRMMQRFIGCPPVQRCGAWFYYVKKSPYIRLIHAAKYNNHPEVGRFLAACAATEWSDTDFFHDIDVIVPLPLSKQKRRQRGYNQCDFIVQGLSDVTHLPIEKDALIRAVDNSTQTRQNRDERWENVQGIFQVTHPEKLAGRHILLVDDVVTTGATLLACAETLEKAVPDIRITLFALAAASE